MRVGDIVKINEKKSVTVSVWVDRYGTFKINKIDGKISIIEPYPNPKRLEFSILTDVLVKV